MTSDGENRDEVYRVSVSFFKKIYGLTAQIRLAADSVPSNIAESAARGSDREFVPFLRMALGPLAELETQRLLAQDLGFAKDEALGEQINPRCLLVGLIGYVRRRA